MFGGPYTTVSRDNPDMAIVAMPMLLVLLETMEEEKRAPLTEREVVAARDKAACIAMEPADAAALAVRRGRDVDIDDPWAGWQDYLAWRSANRDAPPP